MYQSICAFGYINGERPPTEYMHRFSVAYIFEMLVPEESPGIKQCSLTHRVVQKVNEFYTTVAFNAKQ